MIAITGACVTALVVVPSKAGKPRVEAGRHVLPDLQQGSADLEVIVEQPLGRGRGCGIGPRRHRKGAFQPRIQFLEPRPDLDRARMADQSLSLVAMGELMGSGCYRISVWSGRRRLSCR